MPHKDRCVSPVTPRARRPADLARCMTPGSSKWSRIGTRRRRRRAQRRSKRDLSRPPVLDARRCCRTDSYHPALACWHPILLWTAFSPPLPTTSLREVVFPLYNVIVSSSLILSVHPVRSLPIFRRSSLFSCCPQSFVQLVNYCQYSRCCFRVFVSSFCPPRVIIVPYRLCNIVWSNVLLRKALWAELERPRPCHPAKKPLARSHGNTTAALGLS